MLFPHEDCMKTSFGFKYLSAGKVRPQLINIGWERVESEDYYWDGKQRGSKDLGIFQYTLSGSGTLRYGKDLYTIKKHNAIFCTLPHDHAYYFSQEAGHWEFIYILVSGEDAIRHWRKLTESSGPVMNLQGIDGPIRIISQLYKELCDHKEVDNYYISAKLYEFLIELHRMAEGKDISKLEEMPEGIRNAMKFMESKYAISLSLDEITEIAGLSKYHFCRLFLKKTGLKPIQYLRKIRVEKAAWQLRNTKKTIEVIARETGFDNSNYFIKVFRTFVGVTPTEYRTGKTIQPVHFLRVEV